MEDTLEEQEDSLSFEYLSISRINTYMKCPKAYEFRYVQDEKIPPAGPMMLGWTVHDAVEFNWKQKILTHEDLKTGDVLDHFGTAYDFRANDCLWDKDVKPGELKDQGYNLISLHHKVVSPKVQPLLVEEEFNLLLSNRLWYIKGRIDTMDDEHNLLELKTSGRKKQRPDFSHRLQSFAYTVGMLAGGNQVSSAMIRYLIRHKDPDKIVVQEFPANPTQSDITMFLRLTTQVARGIENEVFPINRQHMLCSRKWCGYWHLCEKQEGGTVDP